MVYIGMNPYMIDAGGFVLSWHGFFAFLGVVVAVVLVTRWGPAKGVPSDDVYGTAIWAIIGGIVGARLVHVIDRWDYYGDNLIQSVELWNGGIALLGSIIGGFI
ncbi:MAG: prolipoprotein diacylglyceryl transferase, partial [Dehalococcoidia bacterium]|nr:prolipoprotein diacylglyceryl transferase [Dehalococcoidia bacterium]